VRYRKRQKEIQRKKNERRREELLVLLVYIFAIKKADIF
jgi:hypothetical protein